MSPHPVVAAKRQYDWLSGQAACLDRALAGLVLAGAPSHVIESQRVALDDLVAQLDAAHLAVKRRLSGR